MINDDMILYDDHGLMTSQRMYAIALSDVDQQLSLCLSFEQNKTEVTKFSFLNLKKNNSN